MRSETIAIHSGYDVDPTTKSVAVPIYQTVAYEFDSAEHGAALFNLEVDGFRYSRISNPTTAVLERRVAALEGGVEALCVSSGQAALNYATLNVTELGSNIVSVPQLYGTTHTLFAHLLPSQGVGVRFAESDQLSELHLFLYGRQWFLKYRFTYPQSCESDARAALAGLTRQLPWAAAQQGAAADPPEPSRMVVGSGKAAQVPLREAAAAGS